MAGTSQRHMPQSPCPKAHACNGPFRIGFNAGSAFADNALASHAFVNTFIATCGSLFVWIICDRIRGHAFKATGICLGIVVGLVVITPAAGFVNAGAALLIGIVGAWAGYVTQRC